MNKALTSEELRKMAVDYPAPPPRLSTTYDRLLHWAALIDAQQKQLRPVHEIEYWSTRLLATAAPLDTVFAIAASDPELKAAGLVSSAPKEVMRFFGMQMSALHYIVCDCGGHISNARMAHRIRDYAAMSHRLAPPHVPVSF
jgi:hypothetical protein